LRQKIFGWLIKFPFSGGVWLSDKKFGGGAAHDIKFWRGSGAGVYPTEHINMSYWGWVCTGEMTHPTVSKQSCYLMLSSPAMELPMVAVSLNTLRALFPAIIGSKLAISLQRGPVYPKFQVQGGRPH